MEIRTLEQISISDITNAFNEAFSDYFIKLQFSEEGMVEKMKSEGVKKEFSVGAFHEGQLIGFILHGYDVIDGVKTIYNAGTGVIPAFRGKRITQALYQFAIPLLSRQGINSHLLEVIEGNGPALHVYQKMGFKTVRVLNAFKNTEPQSCSAGVDLRPLEELPSNAADFFSFTPSWQNSVTSISRNRAGHELIGVFEKNALVGFAAYLPSTGRIKLYAVHPMHRRKGIGRSLVQHIAHKSVAKQLTVTNVDESYTPALEFLQSLHFERFLRLYEMQFTVTS